jgi:ABC-type branched-chain amino acid transport system, permease component
MKQKDLILYSSLIILGLVAPYLFSAFKVQLTYLCVLIVLAMTWNLQGGEMGYNTFGNILFYGLGMYLTASVQVGMFFPLAEWTESGGEKTFVHTTAQYFQGNRCRIISFSSCSCCYCWRYRLRYFRD